MDWDLATWQQPTVFNLDMMRAARMLRRRRTIVRAVDSYDDRLQAMYVFKEHEDNLYPAELVENDKVSFYGRALGEHSMFFEEYSNYTPDTSIYHPYEKYYKTHRQQAFFNKMLLAGHTRLLGKNNEIIVNWEQTLGENHNRKTLVLHDLDINANKSSIERMKIFCEENKNIYVGFRYPILVRTQKEFEEWLSLPLSANLRTIKLEFLPEVQHIRPENTSLADLVFDVSSEEWDKLFLLSLYLLQEGHTVKWDGHDVLNQYFVYYRRERSKAPNSFFDYVKYRQNYMTSKEKANLFQYYKEENEDLINHFYLAEFAKFKGDTLVAQMYTMGERRERR